MTDYAPLAATPLDQWAPKRTLTLKAARAHSRRVRQVRLGLLWAAGALLLLLAWEFSTRSQTVIFEGEIDETVRMVEPRYVGRTADGLPYTLTALEASRVRERSDQLDLDAPLLNFYRVQGADASTIRAATGRYNDVARVLELQTTVVLTTDDGNVCETDQARLHLDEKRVEGDSFIRCTGSFGIVEGNAFEITDAYSVFVFKNGMTGELQPDGAAPTVVPDSASPDPASPDPASRDAATLGEEL